jgi:hypothetical protein
MNLTCYALGAAALLALTLPVAAHHSFAAEFDQNKSVSLKGEVAKLEWFNPHIWLYLDVKDEQGAVARWQCEGGAPNSLTRNGWSKDSLKPGDAVVVEGYLAKDASNTCSIRSVKLPDGRGVFLGAGAQESPEK